MEWRMAELDAREAIEEALAANRALFAERGIVLETRLPQHLPRVFADRDRLIQVLVNLLSNAVKFCEPARGRVEIHAEALPGRLRIAVIDDGPGVPEDSRAIVFEKFQQLQGQDLPQGTGLGLAISRQIVEHFGGRIWVESAPNRGARFVFTLPLPSAIGDAAASK